MCFSYSTRVLPNVSRGESSRLRNRGRPFGGMSCGAKSTSISFQSTAMLMSNVLWSVVFMARSLFFLSGSEWPVFCERSHWLDSLGKVMEYHSYLQAADLLYPNRPITGWQNTVSCNKEIDISRNCHGELLRSMPHITHPGNNVGNKHWIYRITWWTNWEGLGLNWRSSLQNWCEGGNNVTWQVFSHALHITTGEDSSVRMSMCRDVG